jgi:hypothetical protein
MMTFRNVAVCDHPDRRGGLLHEIINKSGRGDAGTFEQRAQHYGHEQNGLIFP